LNFDKDQTIFNRFMQNTVLCSGVNKYFLLIECINNSFHQDLCLNKKVNNER
jgi:hypothetical protein